MDVLRKLFPVSIFSIFISLVAGCGVPFAVGPAAFNGFNWGALPNSSTNTATTNNGGLTVTGPQTTTAGTPVQLTVTGGVQPYTYPQGTGYTVSTTGLVTPQAQQSYPANILVTVQDNGGHSQAYAITVLANANQTQTPAINFNH